MTRALGFTSFFLAMMFATQSYAQIRTAQESSPTKAADDPYCLCIVGRTKLEVKEDPDTNESKCLKITCEPGTSCLPSSFWGDTLGTGEKATGMPQATEVPMNYCTNKLCECVCKDENKNEIVTEDSIIRPAINGECAQLEKQLASKKCSGYTDTMLPAAITVAFKSSDENPESIEPVSGSFTCSEYFPAVKPTRAPGD